MTPVWTGHTVASYSVPVLGALPSRQGQSDKRSAEPECAGLLFCCQSPGPPWLCFAPSLKVCCSSPYPNLVNSLISPNLISPIVPVFSILSPLFPPLCINHS